MPVNTAYLNTYGPVRAMPSIFTVALTASAVPNTGQVESSFSLPARLILPQGRTSIGSGWPIFVGPDSAISATVTYCAYSPGANSVTLRLVNVSASTVTQRAGTWAFAYVGDLP
jgi:hypothetical protein